VSRHAPENSEKRTKIGTLYGSAGKMQNWDLRHQIGSFSSKEEECEYKKQV
jgi:hypothetical protein